MLFLNQNKKKGSEYLETVFRVLRRYIDGLYMPDLRIVDVVEIMILAVIIYFCISWIKRTRAYTLLKGIYIVAVFILLANLFQMTTLLWIMKGIGTIALTALVIIFQPELRKALEDLGQKKIVSSILPIQFDSGKEEAERYSDKTITELVRAVYDMSEVKTGALIVLEMDIILNEYVNTGIKMDSLLSSQLLINIFEHNTPLHDGAIIVQGDRILAATCYLPLSDNKNVSKHLGTRHRAALGISEVSDSFTIVVSEETGRVSYAYGGALTTEVQPNELKEQLIKLQKNKMDENESKKFRIWKGRDEHEQTSKN